MPSDREVVKSLGSEFQRLEDFEKFQLVAPSGGLDALIGVSTRFFLIEGYRECRRHDAIAATHDYCERFKGQINFFIDYQGQAKPFFEGAAFKYFESQVKVDDPDRESLDLAVVRYPDREPARVPLHFVCRLSMEMPYWAKFNVYSEWANSTNFSALGEPYQDALVARVLVWAAIAKPRHGTSGVSFLLDQTSNHQRSGQTIFPLLMQFPGIDYDDGGGWITHAGLHQKIRSINWLTIIDDEFVDELGGLDSINAALGPHCPVHRYDGGIVIQAGPKPEIGDANSGIVPGHYRTVARVLKPIRFESYYMGLLHPPPPLDPMAETLKWIRRFD